jgi:hypothetical protein
MFMAGSVRRWGTDPKLDRDWLATMFREPPIYGALKERTLALWRKKSG